MPDSIAIKINLPESLIDNAGLPRAPLFYSVSDGAAQLYEDTGKALQTSKLAKDKAFLMDMHAVRARNAAELAAIARHYLPAEVEIEPVALPEVTPDPIRFALFDWRITDHPDTASWPDDPIATEPREIVLTHDRARIDLSMAMPDGHGTIGVWVELQGKRLIVHAYDPAHDTPLNIRIGETSILIDTHDRDVSDAPGSTITSPRATVR